MISLSRRARAVMVALAAVAATACEATTTVAIDVAKDGSGTVEVSLVLDAEAASELGIDQNPLATDDLESIGWSVDGPTTQSGGAVLISALKPFANPEEFPELIAEVSGPGGPLQDFRLTHSSGFASSSLQLEGNVTLTGSLAQFSDAEVAGYLDGFALGRSSEELAEALAASPDGLRLDLSVSLPYDVAAEGSLAESSANSNEAQASWVLGSDIVDKTVQVRGEDNNRLVVMWLALAAAAVALGMVLIVAGTSAGRRRASRPARAVPSASGQEPMSAVSTPDPPIAAPVESASPTPDVAPVTAESLGDERPRWSEDDDT